MKLNKSMFLMAVLLSTICARSLSPIDIFLRQFGTVMEEIGNMLQGPKIHEVEADKENEEYDFIIIGAGPAGCVLASRLTEVPEWKVLLLEAGFPENPIGQIPAISQILQVTKYSWGYKTTPQVNGCLGMINNECRVASGKGLGGGSAIGDNVYTRGNQLDYDLWAAQGNTGWSYADVLPYFRKSEDVHLKSFDRKYHGLGGPMTTENVKNPSRVRGPFIEAANELGYDALDYNGAKQIGVSSPQLNTMNGRRRSVSKAYLENASNRNNLAIKTRSTVTEVIINPTTKQAEGVKYTRNGKTLTAKSKQEVIVSGGVFNTPQLLMLSGIGPREHLENFNITCLEDLQVGDNFRDHIGFIGLNFIFNESTPEENYLDSFMNWFIRGKGPLTACGIDALGYIESDTRGYPAMEVVLIPVSFNQGYGPLEKVINLRREIYDSVWGPTEGQSTFTIMIMLLRAKSTGTVRLKSKNSNDHPLLDGGYLTENEDVETILTGVNEVLKLTETDSFKKLGAKLNTRRVFGCEDLEFGTDDYWRCAIPRQQISTLHPSGTCKMGPSSDKNAVVDARLKVHGIKSLRVVDGSVVPNANTAHMQAPVVMIAEKAADIIKEDWNYI